MRADWRDGERFLVRSVSWGGGSPHLDLAEVGSATRAAVPLIGTTLAFTVPDTGPFCLGRAVFAASGEVTGQDCPGARRAVTGRQCAECAAADEFRFIHHVHRGGYVPDGLREYVARPHWVYIATFADGSSKVGTAVHARKRTRLDEQGAVRATYLAWADSGVTAREYEDLVSGALDIVQSKRRSAKLTALARPRPAAEIERAHGWAVQEAREVLEGASAVLPLEPWEPPAEHAGVAGASDAYPHALTSGEHCLTVVAMVGSVASVTVNGEPELFLADLGVLVGRHVVPGPVRSPGISTQLGLF
ncbi:DUF2797 domain-containing protein [Nocardia sp. NPDC057353]|uniref:DUF2797 domain-containing protein n=1 Tax=Nocardia sp. NPDC057353 TaxID=3346104 RepID=UPI00362BD28D